MNYKATNIYVRYLMWQFDRMPQSRIAVKLLNYRKELRGRDYSLERDKELWAVECIYHKLTRENETNPVL